jgi:hypothetical protein
VLSPARAFEAKRAVAKMAETNRRIKPPLGDEPGAKKRPDVANITAQTLEFTRRSSA